MSDETIPSHSDPQPGKDGNGVKTRASLAPRYTDAWIERYVRGTLSAEDMEAFEMAMFDDKELQERLEIELLLRESARWMKSSDSHSVDSPLQWSRVSKRRLLRGFAMAASLVLALGLGVSIGQRKLPVSSSNVALLSLDVDRGGSGEPARLQIGTQTAWVVLEVPVDSVDQHALTIQGESSPTSVLHFDHLQPKDGLLRVLIPTSDLPSGLYDLECRSQVASAAKPALRRFRVVAFAGP